MPEDKAAEKAAAEKAAADKATATHGAATEGARSVADAVKRVADAAVAEVQKTAVAPAIGDFVFSGTPGGRFRIDGSGLGTNGTLKVNGVPVPTTGWGATHIEGVLPSNVTSGEVLVQIDDKTTKRGYARF